MSELKGVIKYIGKVTSRQVGDKTYYSQKMLLEVSDEFKPQTIPMEIGAKLQDQMDQYKVGQTITAHYNLRGNAYTNTKTGEPDAFLSLSVWRIVAEGAQPIQSSTPVAQAIAEATSNDDLGLPF